MSSEGGPSNPRNQHVLVETLRLEWIHNRKAVSPWMMECLDVELERNMWGDHEACGCRCRECFQLTWLRAPQCQCRSGRERLEREQSGRPRRRLPRRWLSLVDKIRFYRRACTCHPADKYVDGAWYCYNCIDENTSSAPTTPAPEFSTSNDSSADSTADSTTEVESSDPCEESLACTTGTQ